MLERSVSNKTSRTMNTKLLVSFGAAALLQFALVPVASTQEASTSLALDSAISTPIDVSPDGELVLLFLPGLQGFELVNTKTGERTVISATPCTGYFATLSPDKKYVCFKDFSSVGGRRLQVPSLFDVAQKQVLPLATPLPAAGNPVVSSRGQVAYTLGEQLVVLNPDLSPAWRMELGGVVNVLAFSPDGRRLAFGDAQEQISWIDLDSGQRTTLPASSVHGYQPRFSPKGQSLLARSSNGEVTGRHLASGRSRSFGPAETAAWLDEDTVALVRKEVANFAVTQTHIASAKLSDGSGASLLTRAGDAAIALHGPRLAWAAQDGISLGDTRTGVLQKAALQPRVLLAAPAVSAASVAAPAGVTPLSVGTNGTTVQLTGVPYIQQLYDSPDSFPGGGSCCNATATLMAIQYYGRLPTHPITCTRGGTYTSNYGFYISSLYSYNGHVFNIASADWSLTGYYGGFGYFLQDAGGSSLQHSIRLMELVQDHGLSSATDDSATIDKARAEINANHPVIMLNSLTTAGHYITCIGYIQNQYSLIFNDPYGNKASAYPGWAGAGAIYDWPGYNNGNPNLNNAWRYVYARGTASANTSFGSYWDRNGATAGAGTTPSGTWDSTSTNWSSSSAGTVGTGPWAEQNAYFAAGSDATGSYAVTVSGGQVASALFVQEGTVTFTGGQLYFLGTGSYFSNYVGAGATAIFNTPFYGGGSPDKWGPGTAVYNGASTSTGYYTHNEGTLAFGNNTALSTARLDVGDTTGANVVTLKSADSTAHTLANYLAFLARTINVGAGGDLTFSGPVKLAANTAVATTLAVSNGTTTFSGTLTNSGGLTKTGPGTLLFSGANANTYGSTSANGNTTVSGGTLKLSKTAGVAAVPNGGLLVNTGGVLLLGGAHQIGDAVPMTLSGGTFQTAGFSEQLGTLKLTSGSTIDLAAGSSVLTFAASSGVAWTAGTLLTITHWNGSIAGGGTERVLFDSSSSGLSVAQVSQIRFANPPGFPAGTYAARILATGEVVPLTASPSITSQPQNRVALVGDTVSFICDATGTPAPAWQWRCCGTNVPAATGATFTLPQVTLAQAGTYSFAVTNIAGTATSSTAVLSVYGSLAPTLSEAGLAANGDFQLSLTGVPGYNYAIWASTNLSDWLLLQTNASPFSFTDTNASTFQARFYRAQYQP